VLGLVIAACASLGDAGVMSATGGVLQSLQAHGQGDNASLRNQLYEVVLTLQRPWAVAQWMGIAVAVLEGVGFAKLWRGRGD
jgi:hypothetical protein